MKVGSGEMGESLRVGPSLRADGCRDSLVYSVAAEPSSTGKDDAGAGGSEARENLEAGHPCLLRVVLNFAPFYHVTGKLEKAETVSKRVPAGHVVRVLTF